MNIDADTHVLPRQLIEYRDGSGVETRPKGYQGLNQDERAYWNVDVRKAAMRDALFDKQILMVNPGDLIQMQLSDAKVGERAVRIYNDAVADLQKKNEEFVGCAEVPATEVGLAIGEAERAVNDLGLKAVRIAEGWLGKSIVDRDWMPFYEAVHGLKVPLWYHGAGMAIAIGRDRLLDAGWVTDPQGERKPVWATGGGVGQLAQAVGGFMVVSALVLQGVLKKYPGLKIAVVETGALLQPFVADRLDKMYYALEARRASNPAIGVFCPITTRPSEYVRKHFWFDTDRVGQQFVSAMARERQMADRMILTSDYPHAVGDQNMVRWIDEMDISSSDKERIKGKNTAELLGI